MLKIDTTDFSGRTYERYWVICYWLYVPMFAVIVVAVLSCRFA
jgi:hypothetical protein